MKINKNGIVELDACEAVAYWWTKKIKSMVTQFKESEVPVGPKREQFVNIFDYEKIKNAGYRKIYLELAEKIRAKSEGKNRCSIRTNVNGNGHAELISWLSEIMGEDVPSLNIGEIGSKELTVMIVKEKGFEPSAFVGESNSCGSQTRLPNRFKPNPVLCGKVKKEEASSEMGEN